MSLFGESLALSSAFLFTAQVPRGLESGFILIALFTLQIIFSAIMLYAAIKMVGGGGTIVADMPKALFTAFILYSLIIPFLFMAFYLKFVGVIIALLVWLALIKYMFNMPWLKALFAFMLSIVLSLVVLFFVMLPVALLFL